MANFKKSLQVKLSSKKFSSKYSRVPRENTELHEGYVLGEDKPFLNPEDENFINIAAKECPFDGFHLVNEIELTDNIPHLNSLHLYRMLKLMYGEGDIIGGILSVQKKKLQPGRVDWSYTVRVQSDNQNDLYFIEIVGKFHNSRLKL